MHEKSFNIIESHSDKINEYKDGIPLIGHIIINDDITLTELTVH